jgi:hypothetical protein
MSNDKIVSISLNPLAFIEVDEPWASTLKKEPTIESVIKYLCAPETPSDLQSIVNRYKEISTELQKLFYVPNEERMIKKLVWPLRNAKASYVLGNYLGTIALCGMVAEMVTLLKYEVSKILINDHPITEKEEETLFGRSFERLDQIRRVQVLRTYGLISDDLKSHLDLIREKRKIYLHYYSADEANIAGDALKVFHSAVSAVAEIIGQGVKDGKLALDQAILDYLEKLGLARPSN